MNMENCMCRHACEGHGFCRGMLLCALTRDVCACDGEQKPGRCAAWRDDGHICPTCLREEGRVSPLYHNGNDHWLCPMCEDAWQNSRSLVGSMSDALDALRVVRGIPSGNMTAPHAAGVA